MRRAAKMQCGADFLISIELGLCFVIGVLAVKFLFLGQEVKADSAAGVHIVLRIKVIFEYLENAVFFLADVALEPRGEHLADAVVVAYRRTGALDSIKDSSVVCLECLLVLHFRQEDEIQVRTLRIAVAHMSCDDGVWQRVADLAHVKMHLLHV